VKEKLESLVAEMIEKRILLDEAVGAFEKKFIQIALGQTRAIRVKPPKFSACIEILLAERSQFTN
jgi:hypothetical protein